MARERGRFERTLGLFETRFKRLRGWDGFEQEVEAVVKLQKDGTLFNGIIAAMIQILYFIIVAFSYGMKKFVTPEERMNVKIIVLRDTQVPVLIATLRWIYEIPVQPSQQR